MGIPENIMEKIGRCMPIRPLLVRPCLDKDFKPAVLVNEAFRNSVRDSGIGVPLEISIERDNGLVSVFEAVVFAGNTGMDDINFFYIERFIKSILWIRGGFKISLSAMTCSDEAEKTVSGLAARLRQAYSPGGCLLYTSDAADE